MVTLSQETLGNGILKEDFNTNQSPKHNSDLLLEFIDEHGDALKKGWIANPLFRQQEVFSESGQIKTVQGNSSKEPFVLRTQYDPRMKVVQVYHLMNDQLKELASFALKNQAQ